MDTRIQELIAFSKEKWGLDNYFLYTSELYQRLSEANETIYTLNMEWFPNIHKDWNNQEENPEGTASIDINIHTKQFESVIFVGGITYVDKVHFPQKDKKEIIAWLEKETGLQYEQQFILEKEAGNELTLKGCLDGLTFSPSYLMEVHYDEKGKLTFYSLINQFPTIEKIVKETYTLSLNNIDSILSAQLQLIEFPSDEKKCFVSIYAIEEIFVRNDGTYTIPIEISEKHASIKINEALEWDQLINEPFERQYIRFRQHITADQAFAKEPHPASYPITDQEQQSCIEEIRLFLQKVYPNDTGKWTLTTLYRELNYIHAELREQQPNKRFVKRKLLVMIEAETLKAVNYMDNNYFLEIYKEYKQPLQTKISKEEAYQKIKDYLELKPRYVYDRKQDKYVQCGLLDCQHYVDAVTGEIGLLNDL